MLISLAFLVPLLVLGWTYLATTQASLEFTQREQIGVKLLQRIEPWVIEAQKQRRMRLSGLSSQLDEGALKQAQDQFLAAYRPQAHLLKLEPGLQAVQAAQQAAVMAGAQAQLDDTAAESIQRYVDALQSLRGQMLDQTDLTLDPDQDTFYLMMIASEPTATVIESISRSRAMAGLYEARNQAKEGEIRELYAVRHLGMFHLEEIEGDYQKAVDANPDIAKRFKVEEAMQAARGFYQASAQAWFGDTFSAQVKALGEPGQRAVDQLRQVSQQSAAMLAELLQARVDQLQRKRWQIGVVVAACIGLAFYLFLAFFRVMKDGLGQVSHHLEAMAHGDLSTRPTPHGRDETADLVRLLLQMQAALTEMVRQVRSASGGIVTASAEIADASADLSARTEQSAASLEQSASAMEEIGATIRHSASKTEQVTRLAAETASLAQQGEQVFGRVVQSMDGIRQSSSRISDIIGVIDGIAFQTNILALNASVEAARAGEQGRGFAVVASEVRLLAGRSAEAAREIKTLIAKSVEQVEQGAQTVQTAEQALLDILGGTRQTNDLLADMAQASGEQTKGVAQVGVAIHELDQATQGNAAMVEETAASAAALKEQAERLREQVDRFKLG